MDVTRAAAAYTDELIALRRDLHAHPELGFQEFRTAEIVETYLRGLGMEPKRLAGTGVSAVLQGKKGPGPVLLLRADMDALPVQEETGLPFSSENPGVMHACGHDAHTAMLLVAAKVLADYRDELSGSVKFVFQPNEEIAGAQKMIDEGVLCNPPVDAAMGMHIWSPLPSGTFGIKSGAVTASMDVFKVTVKGKGGHTGYPESAVDPVIAASEIVQQAQRIQTRLISPMKAAVIMFGKIQGGSKNNIIPDEVVLEGTIRYLYPSKRGEQDNPTDRFADLAEGVCSLYGCGCDIRIDHENDAVVNDSGMTSFAFETAKTMALGHHIIEHASMACEDFSAFCEAVPSVFVFLGTADEAAGSTYPHHNPRFTVDEKTLPAGVEFFVRSALRYLSKDTAAADAAHIGRR